MNIFIQISLEFQSDPHISTFLIFPIVQNPKLIRTEILYPIKSWQPQFLVPHHSSTPESFFNRNNKIQKVPGNTRSPKRTHTIHTFSFYYFWKVRSAAEEREWKKYNGGLIGATGAENPLRSIMRRRCNMARGKAWKKEEILKRLRFFIGTSVLFLLGSSVGILFVWSKMIRDSFSGSNLLCRFEI